MPEYETLTTGGTYASFKDLGDSVEGRIESFSLDAGSDFDGNPVPQVIVATDTGNVIVEGGNANLKRLLTQHAARIIVGHGINITFAEEYATKYGNKGKAYTVGVTPNPVAPVANTIETLEDPF